MIRLTRRRFCSSDSTVSTARASHQTVKPGNAGLLPWAGTTNGFPPPAAVDKLPAHMRHAALPSFLRTQAGTVLLSVKAQPRAPQCEIGPVQGNELKIK